MSQREWQGRGTHFPFWEASRVREHLRLASPGQGQSTGPAVVTEVAAGSLPALQTLRPLSCFRRGQDRMHCVPTDVDAEGLAQNPRMTALP